MSSPVKIYSTSSETGTKSHKAVTVSSDKHRKFKQKENYQWHTKHQGRVLQMVAIAVKYHLEVRYYMWELADIHKDKELGCGWKLHFLKLIVHPGLLIWLNSGVTMAFLKLCELLFVCSEGKKKFK